MLDRLIGLSAFLAGVCLGVGITALAQLIVSGPFKTGILYALCFVVLWALIWFDDFIGRFFDTGVAKLARKPDAIRALSNDRRWSRNLFLAGVCAGYATGAIWAPGDLLKLFRPVSF